MADKFLTTQNKKIIGTISLSLLAWAVLQNVIVGMPKMPAMMTAQIGPISLLTLAAFGAGYTIWMLWTEF